MGTILLFIGTNFNISVNHFSIRNFSIVNWFRRHGKRPRRTKCPTHDCNKNIKRKRRKVAKKSQNRRVAASPAIRFRHAMPVSALRDNLKVSVESSVARLPQANPCCGKVAYLFN